MIDGIIIKELTTRADERGFFREIIRANDAFFIEGFGQWSHSLMYDGVIKAWHLHRVQTDWWYVVTGVLQIGLCDLRSDSLTYKESMEFLMGDYQKAKVLKIPPGIAHGCKTVQGPVHLLYMTSHVYNPADEIRIAHDDPEIGFDWLRGPVIR